MEMFMRDQQRFKEEKETQKQIFEQYNENIRLLEEDLNQGLIFNLSQTHLLSNNQLVKPIDYLLSRRQYTSEPRMNDRIARYVEHYIRVGLTENHYIIPPEIKRHLQYRRSGRRWTKQFTKIVSVEVPRFNFVVDIVDGVCFVERRLPDVEVDNNCRRVYIAVASEISFFQDKLAPTDAELQRFVEHIAAKNPFGI